MSGYSSSAFSGSASFDFDVLDASPGVVEMIFGGRPEPAGSIPVEWIELHPGGRVEKHGYLTVDGEGEYTFTLAPGVSPTHRVLVDFREKKDDA